MLRPYVRLFATLIAAVGVATCAEAPSTAAKPSVGVTGARLGFQPVFSPAAKAAAIRLADFGINFDHVRVVIVRPVADTVKDTTITFGPSQADVTLDLTVDVRAEGESFHASIDYTNAGGVVFHGEGTVRAHAADQPASAQQITVQYTGPGATVTHIVVSPKTTSVVAPSAVAYTATAFDANNAAVPNTPFSWTTSDASLATISSSGILTPGFRRGTVTVTATTPTGITDNGSLTVSLPPTGIVLVSGGGQTGKAGAALGQPAVVRVTASDGAGVGGVTVNFAAPTGGKVGSASVTTDGNGLASTSLTLGSAVGPESFAAVALGLSVSIPATATAGDAAAVTAVSGGGQSDTVKHALKLPLTVKVSDQFGNPVANVTVNWQRTAGTGSLSGATSVSGPDGLASMSYTLGAAVGPETITASVAGVATPATFTENALSAGPSSITLVSGSGQTGRVLQPLAAPLVVKVTDDAGNPVSGATVSWTATNGTLSATSTTDATGQSSNTLTLGSATGAATATATVAGKSVAFSAVVQPGIVARISFLSGPPATASAGVVFPRPVTVALQDAAGNPTAATNTVTIALGADPAGGTLSGTLTRSAVGGVATFDDLKLDKAGAGYTIVASSGGTASVTSAAFVVRSGAPASLVVLIGGSQTGPVNTPAPFAPSVKVVDANSNPVGGALVTFAPSSGSGSVTPATAIETNAQGIATLTSWVFGVVAGPQSLVASSPGVENVLFNATVVPGPSTVLAMLTQPSSSAQSGVPFATQPVVEVRDAFGNRTLQSGIAVTAVVASGGGTLGGTAIVATDAQGRAVFTNLRVNGLVGTRTLGFATAVLAGVTSSTIALTPGPAAKLGFAVNPTNTPALSPFLPAVVVRVLDADGNTVPTASNTVSLAITSGTGPPGAALTGTTTVAAASGSATFSGVAINTQGSAYSLTATSSGLTSSVSTAFNVTPALPTLSLIAPSTVDAVFVTVPMTLSGANFIAGSTPTISGTSVTATNVIVQDVSTITSDFQIVGGAATSVLSVSITNANGTGNALSFSLFSVGAAPLQLGPSNGDSGGSPYDLDCPAGAVATGLNVRGGSNVDQLQVICQTVTGPSRAFGAATFTAAVGGGGGSPATLACPANYVMTGLTGRIGSGGSGLNDEIAVVCSPVGAGSVFTSASVGSNFAGSIPYSASCPAGLAITGIQGGAGSLLDRTQIKCR